MEQNERKICLPWKDLGGGREEDLNPVSFTRRYVAIGSMTLLLVPTSSASPILRGT